MAKPLNYVELDMRQISLADLDKDERQLVRELQQRAQEQPDWNDFDNYWHKEVAAFYEGRGLSRPEVIRTAAWRIAQDLSARLGIVAGFVRPPDFLGELTELVYGRFPNPRAFCKATGLPEDLVKAVLAGLEQIPLDTLEEALGRIGYAIRLLPANQEIAPERNGEGEPATKKTAGRAAKGAARRSRP